MMTRPESLRTAGKAQCAGKGLALPCKGRCHPACHGPPDDGGVKKTRKPREYFIYRNPSVTADHGGDSSPFRGAQAVDKVSTA